MRYTTGKSGTIHLGKQGEHRAWEIILPEIAAWEAEYGSGEAEILFLPPGEKTPVSITPVRKGDGDWLWTVTAMETACPGYGKCELRYAAGGAVVKSVTYQTYAAECLEDGTPAAGTGPDDMQQKESAKMPRLIDEETGIPYDLTVEGGKLMLQEVE